ncbi:DNA translocase FtsK 4TM domain-containing protein [Brevibacillus ginsengisoli]|uniref:FtsK/SpoIIIE family DNA translocase n=1 Tax=Brevibacillus ginsengisoli TaxID=363854 RepID=UPI003CE8E303
MSRRAKKSSQAAVASVVKLELLGLVVIALSIIGLLESGWIGKHIFAFAFRFLAGTWDFVIPILLIGISLHMMFTRKPPRLTLQLLGCLFIFLGILTWDHMIFYQMLSNNGKFDQNIIRLTWDRLWQEQSQKVSTTSVAGGMVGAIVFAISHGLFGMIGTGLVIGLFFLIGLMFLFKLSYVDIILFIKHRISSMYVKSKESFKETAQLLAEESEKRKEQKSERRLQQSEAEDQAREESIVDEAAGSEPLEGASAQGSHRNIAEEDVVVAPLIRDFAEKIMAEETTQTQQPPITSAKPDVQPKSTEVDDVSFRGLTDLSIEEPDTYVIPTLSILARPKHNAITKDVDHNTNALKLVNTLKSFGVSAIVSEVHRGPAVTRYEIQPAVGVKVSRIVSLTDDLALALAAKDIRIEAPIPGKSAIGIEVPNSEVAVVTLREVLEAPNYQDASARLTVGLGRDISGEPIVADLTKMPHLLVAGATGSGKSVCINGIITSILFKAKPTEVKLMMIDPKMVELNVYNGIPHLLAPVVTDPRRASIALKKVVAEMERRYNLFAKNGARNIEMYNQWVRDQAETGNKHSLLPYIVVIVDELADLMMVAPGEVEDAICRLAQMARAAGIHLIIATQRPSVDVITGVIKANIPSRIAFGVSSMADSRTILDMGGAEKLLGRGDMLYLPMGASKPTRIQGAFVSDKEVEEVVTFVKEQQEVNYQEEMIPEEVGEESQPVVDDELYDQAVQVVAEAQTASASLLQRRLRVGYTRAARLIDMMEAQGIVGPYEGSKPREVRIPRPTPESQIS